MEQQASPGLGPILSLWTYFQAHRKQVTTVAVVVAIAAIGFAIYEQQQRAKVVKAGEALTDLLVSSATRGSQAVTPDQLLRIATENPGTITAGRAVFQAASSHFTDGNYAAAQKQFQRFITENPESSFAAQAQYGIAACQEAQGKSDEAAKTYKNLADRFKATGFGLAASSGLARILESQGKLAEALPLLEDIARTDPNGILGSEARIRTALIQQKLPPPAPVVSQSVTNAP